MPDSGGLSDTLRNMADRPPSDKVDLGDEALEGHDLTEPLPAGHSEQVDLAVDDESGEMIGAVMHEGGEAGESGEFGGTYDLAAPPPTVSYTAAAAQTNRKRHDHSLKAMMVPVFFTVGALLLIPAIWSVLLLLGFDWVWARKSESATLMAVVMLSCWPISGILLFGAAYFYRQIRSQVDTPPQD
jgi:hypothetical protein